MNGLFHQEEKEISAPHDQFPMGKVDEVKDSVDQCQAHGEQGVDTASKDAVENGLQKKFHRFPPAAESHGLLAVDE